MNEIKPTKSIVVRKPLVDGPDKVSGKALYSGDFIPHNCLLGLIFRSPVAHAEIVEVDTSEAELLPGVKAVITGEETDEPFGILPIARFEFPLARDKVRYRGEPVACVAAVDVEKVTGPVDVETVFPEKPLVDLHLPFITEPPSAFDIGVILFTGRFVVDNMQFLGFSI